MRHYLDSYYPRDTVIANNYSIHPTASLFWLEEDEETSEQSMLVEELIAELELIVASASQADFSSASQTNEYLVGAVSY